MTLCGGLHYEDRTRPGVRGWLETGDDSSNPPTFYARLHLRDGTVRRVPRWNLIPIVEALRIARQRKREAVS